MNKNKKQKVMEVNMKKDYYKKGTIKEKTIVNKLIKDLTIENNRNLGKAIVLDAPDLYTKTALEQANMKTENIYIPNFTKSYKKIKAKHHNSYSLYLGELLDKKKNELKGKVTISFFDYMNTFEGSKTDPKNCPKKDIEKYFKYKIPDDKSILIVTLCYRDGRSKIGVFTELVSFVTTSAHKHNYLVEVLPYGKSYGGMFYQVFQIHKIGVKKTKKVKKDVDLRKYMNSGLTIQQISQKTNYPISTIYRTFN
jgi:hypothetical protein